MSGGSYDYVSYKLDEAAETLAARHPNQPHVVALAEHLRAIGKVMHDIEWADSGDTRWDADLDEDIRDVLPAGAELTTATDRAEEARAALESAIANARRTPPTEPHPMSETPNDGAIRYRATS